jgi:hypothetical protein
MAVGRKYHQHDTSLSNYTPYNRERQKHMQTADNWYELHPRPLMDNENFTFLYKNRV